jgi:hypothetical protein
MPPFLPVTASLLLALGAISVAAESPPQVIVEPKPSRGVLLNPGKGWSVHGSPNWQSKEVLDLVGMGVIRLDWADLEPREGTFEWKRLDAALDEWAGLGRVCNLGVMCANTHSRKPDGSATPKWVFEAGARKHEMTLTPEMETSGTPGLKIAPVFDDAVFLEKLRHFLRAFAARYDGDPRIAVLDIRSYGNWGEGHMYPFNVPDIAPAQFREHVQMHLDVFKKTQLCISRNSHLGKFGLLKAVFDWAVLEQHVAPRRDGICGNSDGSETAIGLGVAPGLFEFFAGYDTLKELGWWDGRKDKEGRGFRLDECVENGKPTWVDLGGGPSSLRLLQENRSLVERLTNRIGYHFHLQRAAYPASISGSFQMEMTWLNQGVAPIYIPCAAALALIDGSGKRIATVWPDAFKPRQWMPGKTEKETARVTFPDVPVGEYRLALAITPKVNDAKPFIRLGTEMPVVDGWYVLGNVTVASH